MSRHNSTAREFIPSSPVLLTTAVIKWRRVWIFNGSRILFHAWSKCWFCHIADALKSIRHEEIGYSFDVFLIHIEELVRADRVEIVCIVTLMLNSFLRP